MAPSSSFGRRPMPHPMATFQSLIAQQHPAIRIPPQPGIPPGILQRIQQAMAFHPAATVRPDMAGEHGGGFVPHAPVNHLPSEPDFGNPPPQRAISPDLIMRLQSMAHAFVPHAMPANPQFQNIPRPPLPSFFPHPIDPGFTPGNFGPFRPPGGWISVDTFQPYGQRNRGIRGPY